MYSHYPESQGMRSLPDMGRNPVRFPYPPYYGPHKVMEGAPHYPQPPLNPYGGKPAPHEAAMYGGHSPGWNNMMLPPGMAHPIHKPVMSNKPDFVYPGGHDQHMYRPAGYPDMMNSGYHGYMYSAPYQHPTSYLPPPPPPQMDGYPMAPPPPPPNNMWGETPPVSSANINSPNTNWGGPGHTPDMMGGGADMPRPPSGFQSQSPQPPPAGAPPTGDLHKGTTGSISSLKEALMVPSQPLHDSSSSTANKPYQFNTYLGVGGDSLSHTSPRTPTTARTPDPATPGLIIANSNNEGLSPLPSAQTSNHGNNSQHFSNNPLEMDAILDLRDGHASSVENGESFPPAIVNSKSPVHPKSLSPSSSVGSPLNKKIRSPLLTIITKTHPSLANQYGMSDEPGRKDFLDALFKYMEQEGMSFLKPPSISKCVLDMYKAFTAVQSLGGFTHVVDKRLWKDVLKSFCPASSPSSASLRTLSEFYVKVLLPYECHFSHSSIKDCLSHYEMSHRSGNDSNNTTPITTPTTTAGSIADVDTRQQQPDRTKSIDALLDSGRELVFSEDSQGSLDGFSNQPLPDISVQEAESVLGISTSSTGPTTPSPSFPPGWTSPSAGGGATDQPLNDQPLVVGNHPYHQSSHPNYYGGAGGGGMGPMMDYGNYGKRNMMSPYMGMPPRGYPAGYGPSPMDEGLYGYPPNMGLPSPNMMQHRPDDYHGNMGGDWSWPHPQHRPRLPPPLPPHLQSMMFTPPQSTSPRLATPQQMQQQQQQQQQQSFGNLDSSSPSLEPMKAPPPEPQQQHNLGEKSILAQRLSDKNIKVIDNDKSHLQQQNALPVKRKEPVEHFQPQLVKRKRLNCDHCGSVEPWRVMMSLKCGLPSDSTWAIDTLNILLHDDRTVGFFYLKHHHSLLNTLVNHFNTCLYEIFGKPFQLLEKFSDDSKQPSSGGPHPPPSASVYHHSESDIRLGFSDHLCHLNHSCPITDMASPTDPVDHPMTRDRPSNTIQHIDETTIEQLTKRDTLTERVLLHLNTPRRIMARSPIQKYFLPLVSTSHKVELVEENEIIRQEILPLCNVSPQREAIQRRTLSLCNILRSLSFIPGNDIEFSQHPGLLMILGHILLLHHIHICKNVRAPVDNRKVIENGDMEEVGLHDEAPPTIVEEYWWWSCLDTLRENVFVILANISGQLDISIYPEAISFPLINGLLHWLVCPSSVAIDSLPDSAMVYSLSPQRLVVEALAKMSISEANIDYILATPPLTRLDLVYATLLQFIGQKKHPAVRQFALVLLSNMAQGNEGASRMVGQQKIILPLLLECIESSLMTNNKSRYVSSSSYIDDANSLSLAMLRRAAVTLHCLAKVPVNRISFLPYCNRVLALSMSEALDPSLTSILSDVLYELTRLL